MAKTKTIPQLKPNATLTEKLQYIQAVADPLIYNNNKKERIIDEGRLLAPNPRSITYSTGASDENHYGPGALCVYFPWWITSYGSYPGMCIGVPYGHPDYGQDIQTIADHYHYRVSSNIAFSEPITNVPILQEYKTEYPNYWIIGWKFNSSGSFLTLDSDLNDVNRYTTTWTRDTLKMNAKSAVNSASYYTDQGAWVRIAQYWDPIEHKIQLPIDKMIAPIVSESDVPF